MVAIDRIKATGSAMGHFLLKMKGSRPRAKKIGITTDISPNRFNIRLRAF